MSTLASNIRTIRKELKCTQGSMAEILDVGFRTYVRYEAGERDAPVGVLVKVARLGNISLERLLRDEVSPYCIVPVKETVSGKSGRDIQSCDLTKGTVRFKKSQTPSLITLEPQEARLLTLYRKMPEPVQQELSREMVKKYKPGKSSASRRTAPDKKTRNEQKSYEKLLEEAGELKPDPHLQTGKPGRKKLDRRSLKEKISKLKSIAQFSRKF